MTALAYKSITIPPFSVNKEKPDTEDDALLARDSFQFSQARIESFFKNPSVETEIDQEQQNSTNSTFEKDCSNLVKLYFDSIYRQKTAVSSQKWKGYVTKKNDEYFSAIITDLSNHSQDEYVEIPLKLISQDDLHLVEEGAYFDWHIGYEKLSGTTQKYSKILFRRMPRWTSSEFSKAKQLKTEFKNFLSNQP